MQQTAGPLYSRIAEAIGDILKGALPLPVSLAGEDDPAALRAVEGVNRLIAAIAESRNFLLALSQGRLEEEVPQRNFLISPFKELHASLRHLAWQTRQIARGDLSQHVDFLGDFSTSFNAMIASLREKSTVEEALKRANEMLERQATTDPLTGVANRLKFNESLCGEVGRASRHGFSLSLIIFDIDQFKRVNDSCGHHVGDIVLRQLAALVAGGLRREDLLARWGGEEFVILLPHTDAEGGKGLAERLRRKVEACSFGVAGCVTCSFGVAGLRKEEDGEGLLGRADGALYRAKAGGRNRVECG